MKKRLFICACTAALSLSAATAQEQPFRFDTLRTSRPQVTSRPSATQPNQQSVASPSSRRGTTPGATQIRKPKAARNGHMVFGGSFGLGFGDYTSINIAPQIGYSFNRWLTLGGGFNYNYFENTRYDYTLNYFGMHLFARVYPVPFLVFYVQPDVQRRWGRVYGYDSGSKVFPCLLLGGGFVIPTGGRGGVSLTFYYDVLQNRYTPYGNHLGYSVGYTFNL